MKTSDEERIAEIDRRVSATFYCGVGQISEGDFTYLMNSWLAWKFTAKCFNSAMPEPVKPTVAELEALLAEDDDTPIVINPDGSITLVKSS